MNTSQFMDKQIMDLSSSSKSSDFIDLVNPEEDKIGVGGKNEEILPNYDFQPIRPPNPPQLSNLDANNNGGGSRAWNSADSKSNIANIRSYSSLDSSEASKVILEKDRKVIDGAMISEIDRAMKLHADNLLHALEGVSARLSQLESRTRHLENSVDDLKISVGNNQGSSDGKLRQLENILREVQTGVEDIRDKQDIMGAQLQLAKMHVPKVEEKLETPNSVHVDPVQQPGSAPQQFSSQQAPHVAVPQSHPSHSPPNASFPPAQQNFPPQVQVPSQFPQREPYFPVPAQMHETPVQQYPLPPSQQPQPPPPALPHQPYQPAPQPQYSQPSQPPQQPPAIGPVNSSQPQAQMGHHTEEAQYIPPNYPPSQRQPSSHPSTGVPQQFYGPPGHSYEQQSSRSSSGYTASYGSPASPSEHYSFSGASPYGGSLAAKPAQFSSAPMAQSGGGSYPQLPTARVLPHAIPTASGVNGGSGSAGSGNRVPIDDVVDKVTSMGFPRDHVRATVRKLTDNGQAVDLNIVLDKLMNDGEVQPPKGWFGR